MLNYTLSLCFSVIVSVSLFLYVIFLRYQYLLGKAILTTNFTGICECASSRVWEVGQINF